jgi:hypothetical protein
VEEIISFNLEDLSIELLERRLEMAATPTGCIVHACAADGCVVNACPVDVCPVDFCAVDVLPIPGPVNVS